jgi:serpin B
MRHAECLLAIALAATACHSKSGVVADEAPAPSAVSARAGTPATDERDASVAGATSPDAGALRALADGNNALGIDISGVARKGHPNFALSPVSISMALAMTWAGARGDTAAQIQKVLHAHDSHCFWSIAVELTAS